jgi:hypothetical protein
MKSTIIWDIMPRSLLSVYRRFGGSTLRMEAICSTETSVDTQRTTRRYIPEDGTLHNHHCENLILHKLHALTDFIKWKRTFGTKINQTNYILKMQFTKVYFFPVTQFVLCEEGGSLDISRRGIVRRMRSSVRALDLRYIWHEKSDRKCGAGRGGGGVVSLRSPVFETLVSIRSTITWPSMDNQRCQRIRSLEM